MNEALEKQSGAFQHTSPLGQLSSDVNGTECHLSFYAALETGTSQKSSLL